MYQSITIVIVAAKSQAWSWRWSSWMAIDWLAPRLRITRTGPRWRVRCWSSKLRKLEWDLQKSSQPKCSPVDAQVYREIENRKRVLRPFWELTLGSLFSPIYRKGVGVVHARSTDRSLNIVHRSCDNDRFRIYNAELAISFHPRHDSILIIFFLIWFFHYC